MNLIDLMIFRFKESDQFYVRFFNFEVVGVIVKTIRFGKKVMI